MTQQVLKARSTQAAHDLSDMGSERSFGFVFATLFLIVSLWPLWSGMDARLWALGVAASFMLAAVAAPDLLRPLNVIWYRFGIALGTIMTPVIMALIYVLTVVPVGLAMRLADKDLLRLKRESNLKSYWIDRDAKSLQPGSMRRQF
jgi:hypothetical protein